MSGTKRAVPVASLCGVFLFLCVILIAGLSGHVPVWDETWMQHCLLLIRNYGISVEAAQKMEVGYGPVSPLLYWVLQSINGLNLPQMRLQNSIFLFLTMSSAGILISNLQIKGFWKGFLLMGIPFFPLLGGIAMSDIVSFGFFFLMLLVFSVAVSPEHRNRPQGLFLVSLAGLLFGCTVLTRQVFLMCAVTLPLLLPRNRRGVLLFALFLAFAIPPMLAMFSVWNGFLPPLHQDRDHGFSILFGVLSFCQAGLLFLVFKPDILFKNWKRTVAIFFAGMGLVEIIQRVQGVDYGSYLPLSSYMYSLFGTTLMHFVGLAINGLFLASGVAFGEYVVRRLRHPNNASDFFYDATAVMLLLTPVIMTHTFSSRYGAIALPLIVIPVLRAQKVETWAQAFRILCGGGLGVGTLAFYLEIIKKEMLHF